jgi:hypothetical protein
MPRCPPHELDRSMGRAEWLGIRSFPKELAASKELAGGGISLEFCESPGECET